MVRPDAASRALLLHVRLEKGLQDCVHVYGGNSWRTYTSSGDVPDDLLYADLLRLLRHEQALQSSFLGTVSVSEDLLSR